MGTGRGTQTTGPVASAPPGQAMRLREFWSGDSMRAYGSLAVYTWHAFVIGLLVQGAFVSADGQRNYNLLDTTDDLGTVLGVLLRAFGGILLLFFILSAYLISRPFLASVLHGRKWPNSVRYVLRRILRVHPLFIAVLIAVLLIDGWGKFGVTPGHFVAVASLLRTDEGRAGGGWDHIGHAWSLHVEFLVYLAIPVGLYLLLQAMRVVRMGSVNARAGVIVALSLIAAAISVYAGRNATLPTTVVYGVACFMPGVIIATAEVAGWLPRYAQRMSQWVPRALLLVAAVLALAAMPLGRAVGSGSGGAGVAIYGTVLAMAILMLGILLHELADREPPKFAAWRPVLWFGPMTYPVYLVHVPIMFWIVPKVHDHITDDAVLTGVVTWGLAALPTLVISYLLHKLVELPAMAVGARLGSTRRSVQDRFADQAHPTTPPETAMPGSGDALAAGHGGGLGPVAVHEDPPSPPAAAPAEPVAPAEPAMPITPGTQRSPHDESPSATPAAAPAGPSVTREQPAVRRPIEPGSRDGGRGRAGD